MLTESYPSNTSKVSVRHFTHEGSGSLVGKGVAVLINVRDRRCYPYKMRVGKVLAILKCVCGGGGGGGGEGFESLGP